MTITMIHLLSFATFFFALILLFFPLEFATLRRCHELGGPSEFGRIDFFEKLFFCMGNKTLKIRNESRDT